MSQQTHLEENKMPISPDLPPSRASQRAKKARRLQRRKRDTFTPILEAGLTPRDLVILEVVADYRAATAQQIVSVVQHRMPSQRLDNGESVTTSPQRTTRRLRVLYDSGYLARPKAQDYLLHRSLIRSPIHTLDRRGGEYLLTQGYEERTVKSGMNPLHSAQFMLHELGVAEFHRAIELGLAPHGVRIAFWRNAHRDWIAHPKDANGQQLVTNPDSYFCLEHASSNRRLYFFLEYDRGNKGLKRMRETYRAYCLLHSTGLYRDKPYEMAMKGYRVITATEFKNPVSGNARKDRLQSLRDQADEAAPDNLKGMFLFIREGVYLDDIMAVAQPVFQTIKGDAHKEKLLTI